MAFLPRLLVVSIYDNESATREDGVQLCAAY